jgi:glycosyltransferase involved in cell wall biosynthesis
MTSRKINILYVIDYFHRTGGTERHLAQLVRHLPAERFDCTVVVFDLGSNPLIDELRNSGFTVIHLPVAREYTFNALVKARALSKIIKSKRIDIVQTFHQKSDTYGAVVAKLSGVKYLISSKRDIGDLKKPRHFVANRALRSLFDGFIVVADAVADVIVAKEGIDRSRITRIYNGVDATRWSPPTPDEVHRAKYRIGFAPEDFVVGMVAGFRPEKNHDVFFAGALKAMAAIPSLKILTVGGGPLLEQYRRRYADEIARSKMVFAGDVSDVSSYLNAMDVGCLIPGSNEGFSNSVIEKMAVGLPLIVTAVGGNAEAVEHGQNGFIIAAGDSDALADALATLHADPARRAKMGKRSRQIVEERFTLPQMCEAHEKLYVLLLQ